jgi:hypothetical protein
MYQIGSSKVNITIYKEHVGMLGYGRHFHYMRGVETEQYARAFVFENGGKKCVFVVVDYCFTTIYSLDVLSRDSQHIFSSRFQLFKISKINRIDD